MVEIKIQEKSYDIPTEWKDITLRYWCGLYSIINQYNKRDDEGNVIEAEHSEVELLKMNRDIFIYLTGVSHDEMNMLDVDSVNNAVAIFSQTLEEYKPKGIDKFEFEGEEYLFPKEFLRRNTFGDYIESTHLESTIEIMKHGRFDVLPEQMAILCRRADEEYDDDDTEEDDEMEMQPPRAIGALSEILMISIKETYDKNCRKMINKLDYFKITMKSYSKS